MVAAESVRGEAVTDVKLHLGDCLDVMATMDADSVDSIVTDPPYGLSFMGKEWDHGVPGIPFWEAALRVAKPGAHLLAFGGTRTHHRLMCAIEDAGWEIRDTVMWIYAQGFPKSHDVSKAIDKAAGAERTDGAREWSGGQRSGGISHGGEQVGTNARTIYDAPATPDAERWQGWGTSLKPSFEPVVVARKPLIGTVVQNVLEHGTGAINIDGCRVQYVNEAPPDLEHWRKTSGGWKNTSTAGVVPNDNSKGRWPANLILTYAEDEYMLRHDVTTEQQRELYAWLAENA